MNVCVRLGVVGMVYSTLNALASTKTIYGEVLLEKKREETIWAMDRSGKTWKNQKENIHVGGKGGGNKISSSATRLFSSNSSEFGLSDRNLWYTGC